MHYNRYIGVEQGSAMERPRRSVRQVNHLHAMESRLVELRATEGGTRRSARLASPATSVDTRPTSAHPSQECNSAPPRRRTSLQLSCPNPSCHSSFACLDDFNAHLALGVGSCPRTVGDAADRTCEWCTRTLANRGNWARHITRCKQRPAPVTAVQPVGRFGFSSGHGLSPADEEGAVVLRCDHCGGDDTGITHTRECPGLAHARVAAESDSESDENPQLRDDDVSTTTNDALLDVSFIDTAIPAFSWSWLDALDMSSLPQTRTIDKLPAWVMSATSQIVNQIITDRLITNPNDERGTKLLNIYPHLVLNLNNTRAGSHNQLLRNLKSRVYKFARGQWQLLSMQVMCKRAKRAPVPPSEASMAQRAVRYVQFGDLRKARQALTPAPSAPASDATALTLSQLHPHASAQCPDDV